jgi:hypothetical protein
VGFIAAAMRADLVLLRENPLANIGATRTIESVILRGKLLSRGDLDRILAQVRADASTD